MESTSPEKRMKSSVFDNFNSKTSITCSKVPEGLFDTTTAKKHFSKFGRVQKIKLLPKKQMCIVEYEQLTGAEQAILNAGAFDGFLFDVTRVKSRQRHKKDDDPDWLPDPDVEEELSAMRGSPIYRTPRQKAMDIDPVVRNTKLPSPKISKMPRRKTMPTVTRGKHTINAPSIAIESPVLVTTAQTSLSTTDAATELYQLRSRVSLTADEQWRTLDARDRILRSWGGAGSRVKAGGATIGTCPDMCPEKELLHRQAEHQVMTLETVPDSDGQLEPGRAVKQYSRSSADQEIPMCYELRPAQVLARTCAYLLDEIADTTRQVSLADWFHFMWDRFRGIRKDITQQALCCADSIKLVEICARFHAHCAARLADLEHTQFDQKLNTDNLTKCLQTLKHMYADVEPKLKPREAEFRGYIALLNLGDANFWWEIKQLPQEIQKSDSIMFAIKIFIALDNNNYVRFFRLVKENATYLQACILLRYFNDVRARALARIVKAYAPRGGSRYPVEDIIDALAFESLESMKSFINHYGLRFSKTESELTVILDRNQFIEDSDPYPLSRAVNLIESKRETSVGEVIAGGPIQNHDYHTHILYSSFNKDGKLKETALLAEDLGYNTINDSNKDVKELKAEIQKLGSEFKNSNLAESVKDVKKNIFVEIVNKTPSKWTVVPPVEIETVKKTFLFQPAVAVDSSKNLKSYPVHETKKIFSFSKPLHIAADYNRKNKNLPANPFLPSANADPRSIFRESKNNVFKQSTTGKSLFMASDNKNNDVFNSGDKNLNSFLNNKTSIFKEDDVTDNMPKIFNSASHPINATNSGIGNVFSNITNMQQNNTQNSSSIFKSFNTPFLPSNSIFAKPDKPDAVSGMYSTNTDPNLPSGSLFMKPFKPQNNFSFLNKNKEQAVAANIFNSGQKPTDVYEFREEDNSIKLWNEEKEAERKMQEEKKMEEEEKRLKLLQEEARRKEEERKRLEKQKELEMLKIEEEKKQEELRKKKLEEDRLAELKRKEENERIFKEKVEKVSQELLADLLEVVNQETVQNLVKDELKLSEQLALYSNSVIDDLLKELCREVSIAEIKAELYRTRKVMKKWFHIWKKQYIKNKKRRTLLENTPVWLTHYTPKEEANHLRKVVEVSASQNMNVIPRGFKFTGTLNIIPSPKPINILEVIRSPFLRRIKQINYPYDKCFFWKVTLVTPGNDRWLYRKVNIENWLLAAFGCKNKPEKKNGIINVEKQSWNHLMDFAISVGLTSRQRSSDNEALEGTNGIIFYGDRNDDNLLGTIDEILKFKYPYQSVPIAVIAAKQEDSSIKKLEGTLNTLLNDNIISGYKLYLMQNHKLDESLNLCTRSGLKWLAKNYPKNPPIEIDYLKSICQRYLGNEIWHKLRSETDSRMATIQKDLNKLINCYNVAVDKLTDIITNEDLFNYPPFPLEFNQYLDHSTPYPKPYEFIPSSTKQLDNVYAIKSFMRRLKLVHTGPKFQPFSAINMQQQIRRYCSQIGWFENPQRVACKVVSTLPNNFFNTQTPSEKFKKFFEQYNLIDFLNIVVYEKINSSQNFDNRYAIYDKAALEEYRNIHWIYDDVLSAVKRKVINCEDDLDRFIKAKRRKIESGNEKIEDLILEDKDCTMVEETIKAVDENISSFNNCNETMRQLEKQLDDEKKKSDAFENLLRAALSNV